MNLIKYVLQMIKCKSFNQALLSSFIFCLFSLNAKAVQVVTYSGTNYTNIPDNYVVPTFNSAASLGNDYRGLLEILNSTDSLDSKKSRTQKMKSLNACGNGFIDTGEECDLGWEKNGVDVMQQNGVYMRAYGCSANCIEYTGWNCNGDAGLVDKEANFQANKERLEVLYNIMINSYMNIKKFANEPTNFSAATRTTLDGSIVDINCSDPGGSLDQACVDYEISIDYFMSANRHQAITCSTQQDWLTNGLPDGVPNLDGTASNYTNHKKLRYRDGILPGYEVDFEDGC